jgi:hypothetical protein
MVFRSLLRAFCKLTYAQTESNEETMAGPVAQQVEEPVQVSVNDRMYLTSRHRSAKPTLHRVADEAFMQRHLPDLGQEVEDTQVFTWPLTNWRKLERKMTSPDFACGGHKWQVSRLQDWRLHRLTHHTGELSYSH